MQKIVRSFVADFRKEIEGSRYKHDIVSAIVFGSAARGSFVKGHSDIDIIVVTRDARKRDEIQEYMRSLVDKLNKKHRMFLEKTCSDERKFNNAVLNAVLRLESFFFWGVPIYVLPQTEFDLVKKKVSNPKLWILIEFLGSLNQFLESLKETAIVVYGEDLLKDVKDTEFSMFDKLKLTVQPYYLLLVSFLILPFDAKFSIKHSIKATLLESEFDLLWLKQKTKSYEADERLYEKLFRGHEFQIKHLRKTMHMRSSIYEKSFRKSEAWSYLADSFRFTSSSHAALMSK